jgi:DNA-binding NtrC family response regulator
MLSEYVERATGGTLFVDEISEATPEFQSGLLRLLADGTSQGRAPRTSGVRIVASTNRPVTREVAGGRVRPDLYFALNVIAIQVAPLRERREDILPLARHFLALHAAETGRSLVLTPDAEKALLAYSWPGNVRELENVVERAVVMSSSERIAVEALMLPIKNVTIGGASSAPQPVHSIPPRAEMVANVQEGGTATAVDTDRATEAAVETATMIPDEPQSDAPVPNEGTLQEFLDRAAAIRIRKAIELAKGNRNAAATALGIDRTTLYRLMRRLGL